MSTLLLRAGVVLYALLALPGAAEAQRAPAGQPVAAMDGDMPGKAAADLIRQGDRCAQDRKYTCARRLYREAADTQREAGAAPLDALRRVANTYYFEGRLAEAAAVLLREIAPVAAQHGDVVAQSYAFADAATLYGEMGYAREFHESLDALRKVMRSPYIPESERQRLESRLTQ